jgi:hypothetical protein
MRSLYTACVQMFYGAGKSRTRSHACVRLSLIRVSVRDCVRACLRSLSFRRGLSHSSSLPWLLHPSTKDGSPFPLVRTFGGRGTAPCKFDFAGGSAQVCFTPWGSNTLLVPEYGNDRVQVRGRLHVMPALRCSCARCRRRSGLQRALG